MSAGGASRPPQSRLFVGNLASERTSARELYDIFSKYGNIIEDIVIRRSFGFVQYDNPKSAAEAIKHENGRMIGGMRIGILFLFSASVANFFFPCNVQLSFAS
jgi:RNA recognition motif-containing protein